MKLLLFLTFSSLFYSSLQLQCLNENGGPVDWWVMAKLPYVKGNAISKDGFGYAYADAHNPLKITQFRLDSNLNTALGYTLRQMYARPAGNGYALWNDQSPDDKSPSSKAHSKGVLSFNINGGFFIRHSVPRFPNYVNDGYHGFPDFAKLYGQSFLCISLDSSGVNTVISQMLVNEPFVYDSHSSPALESRYHNLSRFIKGEKVKISSKVDAIISKGGNKFLDFAKSKICDCDLFDSLIAKYYKSDMNTLTWGRPYMPSKCKPMASQNVLNIKEISWNGQFEYDSNKEHSKWGYTAGADFCIGDVNRMDSQRKRGGGATCINNLVLSSAYKRLTKSVEHCF